MIIMINSTITVIVCRMNRDTSNVYTFRARTKSKLFSAISSKLAMIGANILLKTIVMKKSVIEYNIQF